MSETKITIKDNGPLRVEGSFTLVDAEGTTYDLGDKTAISLCRCGKSVNLPFCDGAHGREGFTSQCRAGDAG